MYAGRPAEVIQPLEEAAILIEGRRDPYLSYSLFGNLANAEARIGRYRKASESLRKAMDHQRLLAHSLGLYEIQYLDAFIKHGHGDLSAAEALYLSAHAGFVAAGELTWAAFIAVDLATLYGQRGEWDEVIGLTSGALPILE